MWLDSINSMRPRQNAHRFPNDIFKRIFLNENCCILMKISFKFVPQGPINNNPALVQIMTWCQSGNKPLSESMMAWFNDASMSLGLKELTDWGLVTPQWSGSSFKQWLITCLAQMPLTQPMLTWCQLGHSNKLQWNLNQSAKIFFQGNASENVCKSFDVLTQWSLKWSIWGRRNVYMHFSKLNAKFCILIQMSLKFVSKGTIGDESPSVQVMPWCRIGGKELHELMMTKF